MSVREQMGYALVCDFPDCGVSTSDLGDYAFWGDMDSAIDEWRDADGFYSDTEGAYCHAHTIWVDDDDEDSEPRPMAPTIENLSKLAQARVTRVVERLERRALDRLNDMVRKSERAANQRWARGVVQVDAL